MKAVLLRRPLLFCALGLLLGLGLTGPLPAWAQAAEPPDVLAAAQRAVEVQRWEEAIGLLDDVLKRDPDVLEARYLRGIARREANKAHTLLSGSLADFEHVVARDSLYRDVLYQYALALVYRNQYPEDRTGAIELAERQLQLKPELVEAQVGIFDIYRRFLCTVRAARALAWLGGHPTDYARLFEGEVLRRESLAYYGEETDVRLDAPKLRQADDVLAELLTRPPAGSTELPHHPVLLARARVHYAFGEPDVAQDFVEMAIASIDGEAAARLVFEDFKYVLDEEEWERWRALEGTRDPEPYRAFFRRMWARRDPVPASRVNPRLAEHYRRLTKAEKHYVYHGFRARYNNPDARRELGFPPSYALATELDDRGIVYVRHGEPDDRVFSVDAESWHYIESDMDFHFAVQETSASFLPVVTSGVGNLRLVPTPHRSLLGRSSPIAIWNAAYARLATDPWLARDEIVEESQRTVMEGLTSDRHTWSEDVEGMDVPYVLAAFRDTGGATRLDVHYALPLSELSKEQDEADSVAVEVGIALHDLSWEPLGEITETKRMAPTDDRGAAAVGSFRLTLPPDSYRVALHARSLGSSHLGAYRQGYRVPDFPDSEFGLSSVLPAYAIEGSSEAGPLRIEPNPTGFFARQQPVHLYFEVYNLAPGPDGQARYTIEYALLPETPGRRFLGLFGGNEAALSIKSEHENASTSPVETAELDVSQVAPGRYTLTVTVTDVRTGRQVQRSQPLELVR